MEAWRNPGQKDGALFSRCLPGNWLVSCVCESPSRQRLSNKKSQGTKKKPHVNWESRWMPFDTLRGLSEFLKSSGACQGPCPGLTAYQLWWWRTRQRVQGSNSNTHYCVTGAHASTKKWLSETEIELGVSLDLATLPNPSEVSLYLQPETDPELFWSLGFHRKKLT